MLADIAVRDPETFRRFAERARGGCGCRILRKPTRISRARPARRPFRSDLSGSHPGQRQLKTIRQAQPPAAQASRQAGPGRRRGRGPGGGGPAAGATPRSLLRAGEDVEPDLLAAVSSSARARGSWVFPAALVGAGGRAVGLPARRSRPRQRRHDHPLGARPGRRPGGPRPRLRRPCSPKAVRRRWDRCSPGRRPGGVRRPRRAPRSRERGGRQPARQVGRGARWSSAWEASARAFRRDARRRDVPGGIPSSGTARLAERGDGGHGRLSTRSDQDGRHG